MDINEIRLGVVGIRAKNGLSARFAGTGFLVENNLILTCAHVLRNAARRENTLRICFDDPERFYPAEIVFEGDLDEQDVAVLKLLELPAAPMTPLRLLASRHSPGNNYRTFGYPAEGGGKGIFASGKIEGQEQGALQISSNKITHGYSGAPLWDESLGGVVGMVNAGFEFGLDKKLGDVVFAIPVEALQAAFPALQIGIPSPTPTTLPGDLPHGSHLPFPRNRFFTGRVEDLQKLAETLLGDPLPGVVINQALSGMGGIGKTQLAVEFAYEYGHHFKGVHWLDLRDPQAFESQIALCGEKMGLADWPPTQPEQVSATLRAWSEQPPRLLILDNFEDLPFANPVLSRLRHSGLRLLVTSRHTEWPPALGLACLALEEFSPRESLDFLRNYLPETRADETALMRLAEHLGHLPLALELAARYLAKLPSLGVDEYLAGLEHALEHASMKNWKPEQTSLTGHDLSLAQTFAQSWERLDSPLARQVFIKAGYCAPNTPLPGPVLEAMLDEEGQPAVTLDEALADLLGLGLLKPGPAVHPLLAQFARGLDEGRAALAIFSAEFSRYANRANAETDHSGDYHLYAPLLPHLRAMAGHAESAGMEIAGFFWNSLGYYIKALADYSGAKAAYERALKIFEKHLGKNHPAVAALVNNLGMVLQDLGDLAGAKVACERALKIDEAAYGPDHPSVARDVNNLGGVLQDLGDLAGAKAAYQRALKIDETAYGPDHPDVAIEVNNLGMVLKALGDLAGAQAAFERALKIDEAAYGPDHPSVARDVNNLGMVLKALGDLVGAKDAYQRALKIFEKQLGEDHPNVATGVNNLGTVLQALGDLAGAKAAFERALKIDEAAYGPDHPSVAIRVNNLGMVLKDLGDLAGAKDAYERALKIDEAAYGPDHPSVARDVNNLGGVLQDLGDLADAKAAFERALKIDETAYGPDHPDVAIDVNNLGMVLQALGDRAGAKAAYKRALKINEKFLPPGHPDIEIVRGNLQSLE